MAGQPGRSGGNRPTAPQNNPANVKGLGGNGQSGRYSGFAYGENKALAEQQSAAPIKPSPSFNAGSARMGEEASMRKITPLTAETELPDQPATDGVPIGPGANSIPGLPSGPTEDPDIAMIRDYYPMLEFWASQPGTSQSTKDYVQYLRTII
jgi:hypothetical protein